MFANLINLSLKTIKINNIDVIIMNQMRVQNVLNVHIINIELNKLI